MSVGAGRSAVAIGGGTGLPTMLSCLVELGFQTAAVVTMADDGGSSGVLRRQLGMLPLATSATAWRPWQPTTRVFSRSSSSTGSRTGRGSPVTHWATS